MKKIFISILISFLLIADTNITTSKSNIRDIITDGYHKVLNSLDCFLTNYKDVNNSNYEKIKQNKLYMIVSLKDNENSPLQTSFHIRGKIKLPQLQNRVEITFNKDDEESDSKYVNSEYEDVLKDTRLHVGLKYYLYKESNSQAYAKVSIRTHSPIGLYAKMGIYKSYLYHDFKTSFNHALYYYIHDKKYAASSSVSFVLPLYDRFGIGQKNRWLWKEHDRSTSLEHTIWLYHIIDSKNRLQYQLSYATIDDELCDFCREWYGADIRFRHHISKWSFIEFIPEVLKRRENSFELEKQFTINFGITFSK
jgi:hypothetical protein